MRRFSVTAMLSCLFLLLCFPVSRADKVLIHMDLGQSDHLKAYGVAYWVLEQGNNVEWLLNYRGGSFMADATEALVDICRLRGVSFSVIDLSQAGSIYREIEENNMEMVLLEKAPAIAI